MLSGTSGITSTSLLVSTAGWSMSMPGRPAGSVPVATIRWSYS